MQLARQTDKLSISDDKMFDLLDDFLSEKNFPETSFEHYIYDETFGRDPVRWFNILAQHDPVTFHGSTRDFELAEYIVHAVNALESTAFGARQRGIMQLWKKHGIWNSLLFDAFSGDFELGHKLPMNFKVFAAYVETGELISFYANNIAHAYWIIRNFEGIDGERRRASFLTIKPIEESTDELPNL